MQREIRIRPFRKGDEENIIALTKRCSRPISREEWRWRFMKNPFGKPLIVVAENGEGKIVGHLCSFPLSIKIGNNKIKAWQVVDAAVEDGWRGKGIFSAMFGEGLRMIDEEGVSFLGFPNERTKGIIGKLGVSEVLSLKNYFLLLNSKPLLRKIGLQNNKFIRPIADKLVGLFFNFEIGGKSEIEIKEVKSFGKETESFSNAAMEEFSALVVRDKKYLNWRFAEWPGRNYRAFIAKRKGKMVGYIVLQLREGVCEIVDFFSLKDSAIAEEIIGFAKDYCVENNADLVSFRMHGPFFEKVLRESGFKKNFLLGKNFLLFNELKDKGIAEKMNDFYFTGGDSDWF